MSTNIHLTRVQDTLANGVLASGLKAGQAMFLTNDSYGLMRNLSGTFYISDPNKSTTDGVNFTYKDATWGCLTMLKTTKQMELQYSASYVVAFTVNSTGTLKIAPTSGYVGINSTPSHAFVVGGAETAANKYGAYVTRSFAYDGTTSHSCFYADSTLTTTASCNTAGTVTMRGLTLNPTWTGTYTGVGTSSSLRGISVTPVFSCDKTLPEMYGIRSAGTINNASAVVTNFYVGFFANPTVTSGAVTNCYGIYISAVTAGGTLNYSIYSAGGIGYHAGNWQVGGDFIPYNSGITWTANQLSAFTGCATGYAGKIQMFSSSVGGMNIYSYDKTAGGSDTGVHLYAYSENSTASYYASIKFVAAKHNGSGALVAHGSTNKIFSLYDYTTERLTITGQSLYNYGALINCPATTVDLTADDQLVSPLGTSYLIVSSNDTTATNRTFSLSAGASSGQILVVHCGALACELTSTVGGCTALTLFDTTGTSKSKITFAAGQTATFILNTTWILLCTDGTLS